jgi:hypothetical protein
VAKRRSQVAGKERGRSAPRTSSKQVVALLSQRDSLMSEIEILRSRATAPGSSIDKAGTLLTRHWSKADWQTREEILRAARWILNVGRIHSVTAGAKAR